ncbi:MAG TPA: protein kinase [Polyangiales bacterium]|nr:protein kinase [Polyangiales bacterium]
MSELGRGGMGAVYCALDQITGAKLALKTLELSDDKARALFEREYCTLASLKHPRMVEVFDFGVTDDGRRFYTMELLPGDDLAKLAPLPLRAACEALRDVAASLALLHAQRLLHGDISPRNVRLDASGRAKLLDFGAAAPFGLASEVIGTPECMAPEVLRQRKLDARTDLFSLGALAYFALTGRAAYPVRELRDAEAVWNNAPPPPSKHAPELPKALDQLVLSLLSIDPKGRPASAAEVIDRISAIANLDEQAVSGMAEGHLRSSSLVGRERERTQLRQHLARLTEGRGGAVVIEGASGMGRSRLAQELAVDARIAGVSALRVDALAHPGPLGVLGALAHALLESAPAEALETLPGHLAVLGHAFPELIALRPGNSQRPLAELSRNPTERRALIQHSLCAWLIEVAARRPLLVVVDDVHATDPASASALVGLAAAAQETRLLLCVTRRLDADAVPATQQLERFGARLKLRGLPQAEVEKLVSAVFGETPHRARLVPWLMTVASGNPGRSLELLGGLVERGVIRYESGAWVLPAQLPERELPQTVGDALAERLAKLPPSAAQLLQLFALYHSSLPRRACFKLLPESRSAELFDALDQLLVRGLLAGAPAGYRLAHEQTRALVLRDLDEGQLRVLHSSLGRALLESNPDVVPIVTLEQAEKLSTEQLGLALQAGWHLARGGEDRIGRRLLRNAGIALTLRGDGLVEAVPALDAALGIYRALGRSRFEQWALLAPLTLAGTYFDWRLSYQYGDETLETALDITGMNLARKLSRWLPGKLALGVGLAWGFCSFQLLRRGIGPRTFREAMLGLVALGSATLGTCLVVHDRKRASRVFEQLSALALFPRKHAGYLMHMFHEALVACCYGRYDEMGVRARAVLDWLRRPGSSQVLPAEARMQLEVGVCNLLGQVEAVRTDGSVHEMLQILETAHTSGSRETAAGVRLMYYAHRGERARMARAQEEADVLAAQAGSTWRHDLIGLRMLWSTYALCEDVMGLKRVAGELERVALELPGLEYARDAAQACYLAERQRHTEALALYEKNLARMVEEKSSLSMRYGVAYARILRGAGQPHKAKQVCDELLSSLTTRDQEFMFTAILRLEAQLAAAEVGETESAAQALDELIEAQATHDNPLVHGLAHKARAQVAVLQRDRVAFGDHLRAMNGWFLRTDNPALMGQCQRLSEEGRAAGLHEGARAQNNRRRALTRNLNQVNTALNACRGRSERLQTAIELIIEHSGAAGGYLYLLEADGLRYVAPAVGIEPPEALRGELMSLLHGLQSGQRPDARRDLGDWLETSTTVMARSPAATDVRACGYETQFLLVRQGDDLVVVGAVALQPGDEALHPIEFAFLEEVARGIYSAGDVCTVLTGAPLPSSMSRTVRR